MRRRIAVFLNMILTSIMVLAPLSDTVASAADHRKEVINAIGIMETDKGDNSDGSGIVTRGRFAQMLVNLSSLKDKVSGESSVTLFNDVKKTYWASGYIQAAISQGWMSGYLNGSFQPEKGITLQEAVYAIVKLLGYSNGDLYGNKVSAIMNLYNTKGLNENISKGRTDILTVNDCIHLFYNTLTATTKEGKVYGETLGYSLDSDGEIDYLALINTGVKGPVVVEGSWKEKLPFSVYQATLYKYNEECSYSDIKDYDVLYYSEAFHTVWIYDNKVTGSVDSINPDYTSPSSVTVGGNTYNFSGTSVKLRFSSMGDVKEGDLVTLLLGKDGTVADVLGIDEYNTTITGVILELSKELEETSPGMFQYVNYVTYVDASGTEHRQVYDPQAMWLTEGSLVQVTYVDGAAKVSAYTLPVTSFGNNTVNSDATALGDITFAPNIKILDLKGSRYISIYPERLAGVNLTASCLYYELDEDGELSGLILKDVTGDMDSYGIYTGFTIANGDRINYNYILDGKTASLATEITGGFSLVTGPIGMVFDNNVLTGTYGLTGITVNALGTATVQSNNVKLPMADNCRAYLYMNGEYTAAAIDKISDLSRYNLKAYYDKAAGLGGRIRIIVAEIKS